MATTAEENKRIVRRIPEEVVNEGNVEILDEIVAEDVIDHTPLGVAQGLESFKETAEYLNAAFPDMSVTVEEVVAEGDTVAARVIQQGTHDGEFMGIEPTGQDVEIETMAFLRLSEGEIVERWVRPDQLGLMQQLGVVERPGDQPPG